MFSKASARPARLCTPSLMALIALSIAGGQTLAESDREDGDGDLARRVLQTLSQNSGEDADADEDADAADEAQADRERTATSRESSSRRAAARDEEDRPRGEAERPRLSPVFRSVSPVRSRPIDASEAPAAANGPATTSADDPDAPDAAANTPARADAAAGDETSAAEPASSSSRAEAAPESDADAETSSGAATSPGRTRVAQRQRDTESASSPTSPADDRPVYREYTIREGDTFSAIARRTLGDEKKWVAIAEANPRVDPARLRVGQTIRVPDPERYEAERERQLALVAAAVARTRGNADSRAANDDDSDSADDANRVTVSSGDTLSHISRRVYGRANLWRPIFEANRDQLDSPDDLKVGMKLRIPPRPED